MSDAKDFIKSTLKFEAFNLKDMGKKLKHQPWRLITGVDPISTKVWNKALGTKGEPLVDQMGGAYGGHMISAFGKKDGGVYARAQAAGIDTKAGGFFQDVAHVVAAIYGGKGLSKINFAAGGEGAAGAASGTGAGSATTGATTGASTSATTGAVGGGSSNLSQYIKYGKTALAVGSALKSGSDDSKALKAQAREAAAQGYADEEAQRRQARAQLGEQAAAIAQAGIGYGGTAALVMQDSELAAEMDALNYRYRGLQQARALRAAAKSAKKQSYMLAGSKLLSGIADYKNQRSTLSNAST